MNNYLIFNNLDDFVKYASSEGRWVAIDHGMKRIGLAWTDSARKIALPGEVISVASLKDALSKLTYIFHEKPPSAIILGFPYQMDGTEGEACAKVRLFADKVLTHFHLPVLLYDERLTSQAASDLLKNSLKTRSQRESVDDAVAAYLVLKEILRILH